jgi:NAD(P)-dependent dehydrogenase (short-subunit alcohol dehydrogenase family)
MTNHDQQTALVTGATSGLGFEAALQTADAGYGRVIITGRSAERAETARATLAERSGKDVFETLEVDLNQTASVQRAVAELASRGHVIDYLLLNAGMVSGSKPVLTDEGVEITYASSLIGHHQLTMGVLEHGLLAAEGHIVIAGSEAARGDVPTFTPVDLPKYAAKHFDGDLERAAVSLIRNDGPAKYKPAAVYATTKAFVAWWAASLARLLPEGTTVNAVSPGSAPDTDAARHANFFMRNIMMPFMKKAPGMAADTPTAASRYLEASTFPADVTGRFFASAPKKMTGPLHPVELDHIDDRSSQDAAWTATVEVAGVAYPATV